MALALELPMGMTNAHKHFFDAVTSRILGGKFTGDQEAILGVEQLDRIDRSISTLRPNAESAPMVIWGHAIEYTDTETMDRIETEIIRTVWDTTVRQMARAFYLEALPSISETSMEDLTQQVSVRSLGPSLLTLDIDILDIRTARRPNTTAATRHGRPRYEKRMKPRVSRLPPLEPVQSPLELVGARPMRQTWTSAIQTKPLRRLPR